MKIRFRTCLLPFLAMAMMAPAIRAEDDEAAVKKFMKPGIRVVQEGTTLVELHTLGARDEDLVGLDRFTSLRVLGLSNSQVTDTGLKHLAGMDSLQVLQLYNSHKVTGKGFKEIVGNKNLKELWVDNWQINDEGLIALGGSGKLDSNRWSTSS